MDDRMLSEIEARAKAATLNIEAILDWAGYPRPHATGDHADINNLCAALREAWAERDRLRKALERIASGDFPVQDEPHKTARAALEGKEQR